MRAGPDHRRDARGDICGVEPHPGEPVAPVRQAHVGVLTGPAQRHCLDVLLAVVLPQIRTTTGTGRLNVCSGTRAPVELRMPCRPASHGGGGLTYSTHPVSNTCSDASRATSRLLHQQCLASMDDGRLGSGAHVGSLGRRRRTHAYGEVGRMDAALAGLLGTAIGAFAG